MIISYHFNPTNLREGVGNSAQNIINEYKKFTLKDIESVQYLKYRYLDLYEKLIKFYTKNQMEQKAEKTKKEVKNICSYFAQNDAHVLKYYSCGEEEDMLKRNRLKK